MDEPAFVEIHQLRRGLGFVDGRVDDGWEGVKGVAWSLCWL